MAISISQACDTSAVKNEFLRMCKAATTILAYLLEFVGEGGGVQKIFRLKCNCSSLSVSC